MMCFMPNREQSCYNVDDENCVPLSDVTIAGMPNLATKDDMNTVVLVLAVISLRGIASSHLVVRSMMVKM